MPETFLKIIYNPRRVVPLSHSQPSWSHIRREPVQSVHFRSLPCHSRMGLLLLGIDQTLVWNIVRSSSFRYLCFARDTECRTRRPALFVYSLQLFLLHVLLLPACKLVLRSPSHQKVPCGSSKSFEDGNSFQRSEREPASSP